jgi:hypothetical protein
MSEYQPRVWSLGEVCQHGSLGRQCETCQAQHELAWAQGQLTACEAERDAALADRVPFAEQYCAQVAAERDSLRAQIDEARGVLREVQPLVVAAHAKLAEYTCDHEEDCTCDEEARLSVLKDHLAAQLDEAREQRDTETERADTFAGAIINHLEYNGPCDDADEDEGVCNNPSCTYCRLAAVLRGRG